MRIEKSATEITPNSCVNVDITSKTQLRHMTSAARSVIPVTFTRPVVMFNTRCVFFYRTEPRHRFDAVSASSVKVNGCGRGRGPEFALLVTPFEHFPHQLISSNRLFLFTTTISLSPLSLSTITSSRSLTPSTSSSSFTVICSREERFQERAVKRINLTASELTDVKSDVWWHAQHARPSRLS